MRRMTGAANIGARRAWIWRNKNLFSHRDKTELPTLLVDVSAIIRHDAQTGIQRVVRAVWSELSRRSGTDFVARPIYATGRRGYCYAPTDFLERRSRQPDSEPATMGPSDKFLGLDLSAHLLPKYREQLRAWRTNGATIHIVVYDLLPLCRPQWFNPAATSNFRSWFRLLRGEVDQAICISDQVARELSEQLGGVPLPKIGRLHMGGDIAASHPSKGISAKVQETLESIGARPAILMVGTVEPRKGYEVALAAFEHLWRTDSAGAPDLLIVGKSGWKTSALQRQLLSHPELGKRLHWLDHVSDEGLCRFYDAACGVLVTSRGEGFGLPLIEAAAHRRYVLARDLPVFREQRLQNVLFFDDERPAPLGDRLISFLALCAEGRPRPTRLPSWSESVDRLLVELGLREEAELALEFPLRRAS